MTTAGTIAIFGSPGTGINHLMSLQAASILVARKPRTASNASPRGGRRRCFF